MDDELAGADPPVPTSASLEAVWGEIRSGDLAMLERGIERVWRWYSAMIYSYARYLTHGGDDAGDLAAETWQRVFLYWQAHPSAAIDPPSTAAYLRSVCHNAFQSRVRHERSRAVVPDQEPVDAVSSDQALDQAEEQQLWSLLHDKLPPIYQVMLRARREGLSRAEGCARLGLKPAAWDQRMSRMLRLLRATVEAAHLYELRFGRPPGTGGVE